MCMTEQVMLVVEVNCYQRESLAKWRQDKVATVTELVFLAPLPLGNAPVSTVQRRCDLARCPGENEQARAPRQDPHYSRLTLN